MLSVLMGTFSSQVSILSSWILTLWKCTFAKWFPMSLCLSLLMEGIATLDVGGSSQGEVSPTLWRFLCISTKDQRKEGRNKNSCREQYLHAFLSRYSNSNISSLNHAYIICSITWKRGHEVSLFLVQLLSDNEVAIKCPQLCTIESFQH